MALFAELRWAPIPNLSILPGVRANWFSDINQWAVDPRLLARWELINKTPEFTRTLLQAQETLAAAAEDELQAMVEYNQAMADLAQVTGTGPVNERVVRV
jgi:hypothetical protein